MAKIYTGVIALAALVNLAPLVGVASARRLQALYGIPFADPNLVVLMRHRAVLFGIVGALLLVSVFHLPTRPAAVTAGLVSMVSFVLLVFLVGDANAEIRRVMMVDVIASLLLLIWVVAACMRRLPDRVW